MLKDNDKPLFRALLAIAFALALNVAVSFFEGPEEGGNKNAGKEPRDQKELMIEAIGMAFTGALAFFAFLTVRDGRASSERQLRAYLALTPTFIENYGTTTVVTINYKVTNHGQTPGSNIVYTFTIGVLPDPLPSPVNLGALREVRATSTAFPGDMIGWFHNQDVLTAAEFVEIENGRARIHVHGVMAYLDAFKKERKTLLDFSIGGPDFVKTMKNMRAGKKPEPGYVWIYGPNHNAAT